MRTKLQLRKNYFVIVAIACLMGANAQTVSSFPWTETFESDSASRQYWTQAYDAGNMSWTFATDATTGSYTLSAYQGTLVANYPANSWNGEITKLISPVLDLSGVTVPAVSFYFVNPYWGSEQNILKVLYRTAPANPWTEIAVFDTDVDDWTASGNITLPNPSATYQIALQGLTFYGYSIMVDQLVVADVSLGTGSVSTDKVKVYPNPSNSIVHIGAGSEIQSVSLYNLVGQQVLSKPVNARETTIDLSSLPSGNYLVRINSQDATETRQLVKE